jgi:hypothetical protein
MVTLPRRLLFGRGCSFAAVADDLTDEERRLLVNLLTVEIEASKFPLSPRIELLKRVRAKLRGDEPPTMIADSGTSKRKPRR